MGLVPNHDSMKINTVTQVFLMLEISSTRSDVELLKADFLACSTGMSGPS